MWYHRLSFTLTILVIYIGLAIAQVPPMLSREDGGDYIDKQIALFDYLRDRASIGINVQVAWGVAGDGVTDDTAAIQAALTASNGQPLYFPPGTYVVTQPLVYDTGLLTLKGGPIIYGAGRYQTIFDNRVANGCMLTLKAGMLLTFLISGELKDFAITTTTVHPANSDGICYTASWQILTENVRVQGLTGSGFKVIVGVGDGDGPVFILFDRIYSFDNAKYGINVETANFAVENSFMKVTNSFIQNNTLGGIDAKGLIMTVENTAFTLNQGFGGLRLRYKNHDGSGGISNRQIHIVNSDFEHNAPWSMDIESAIDIIVENCECLQNHTLPTAFQGCFRLGGNGGIIRNAVFRNNFIRVLDTYTPHIAFDIHEEATAAEITHTSFNIYDAAGQVRFQDYGAGTKIEDISVAGFYEPYPFPQASLKTTITTTGATYIPNMQRYIVHRLNITASSPATLSLSTPALGPSASSSHAGKVMVVDIFNNTGGVLTTSFDGIYVTNNRYLDPPNGQHNLLTFIFNVSEGWVLASSSYNTPSSPPLFILDTTNNRVGINSTGTLNSTFTVGGYGGTDTGLETVIGDNTVLQSYNRNTNAYSILFLDGVALNLRPAGTSQLIADTSGIQLRSIRALSTVAPTIASGFGGGAAIVAGRGWAFTLNVGTGGTATGGVIAMNTPATTGWICRPENMTALAANRADQHTVQTASSTTQVTVQNQTVSTGAALAWTAADVLQLACTGF